MHLKTFTAPTMQEALRIIKRDLGRDAVILDTKKIKQANGTFGLEITAAVDQSAAPAPLPKPVRTVAPPPLAWEAEVQKTTTPSPKPSMIDCKLAETLQKHGLQQELQEPLVQAAIGVKAAGFAEEDALEMVLSKKTPFSSFGEQFPTGQVHAIVGPHGAGKTTLVCKLALHLHQLGRKVMLLSMDTEKLGGFEPLRVIGGITQMTAQEFTADMLLPENTTILLDTPGLNPYHAESIRALATTLESLNRTPQVHLVLPATLNGQDMPAMPYVYRALAPKSLIFTRLDECHRYGAMLNTMLSHPHLAKGMVCKSADPAQPPAVLDAASLARLLTTPPTPLWTQERVAL